MAIKIKLKKIYDNLKLKPFRFNQHFFRLYELVNYTEREKAIQKFMDYARSNKLEGDYLEFGLSEGNTFIPAFHFSRSMGKNLEKMRFIGFDSFEGLPKIKDRDKKGFEHFSEGDYKFPYNSFINKLKKKKVDLRRVRLVKGWYNETLNQTTKKFLNLKKAAIVYVDCDLYKSTVPILNFITPLFQEGTILVFDDWFCFRGDPERGEQKAFKEWLQKNPEIIAIEFIRFGWGGNSFILRKKK
jgi:O-methyltransferase